MRNSNGGFNQTYENMKLVRPGDVVFSYAHGRIGAIGQVTEAASASPKPTEFGNVGDYWANEGWLVAVYFAPAPKPLSPKAHIQAIGPMLPARHSPIQSNGNGNQGCYLAGISDALGLLLLALLDVEAQPSFGTASSFVHDAKNDVEMLDDIHQIEGDVAIPETQRLQLAKARIGQGLFRKRVMLVDPRCRVTGVEDSRLLIASHIKPWRLCETTHERLDGANGLLLTPHVDRLFERGLIAFSDAGDVLRSPALAADDLARLDYGAALDASVRDQLIRARRGQGLFRFRVFQLERACRLTGIARPDLLIASHIKPWRLCATTHERLDGANGLLLTPHVDRLFERGLLGFTDGGDVLRSPALAADDLARLGLGEACARNVGAFSERQRRYLEWHREAVFDRGAG
jgi:predicted restriction endonuclease